MSTITYNRQTAKLLAHCCRQTYEQYDKGKTDSNYDGEISPPPGYTQIASLKEREIAIDRWRSWLPVCLFPKVYFGFALTSETSNIIAIRGTSSIEEWIENVECNQINYDLPNGKSTKVHYGFYKIYKALEKQIINIANQLDPSIPCYVTGDSLGSAIAVLAAFGIALQVEKIRDQLQLYTYAGPRVGDTDFVNSYNELIPHSYRVVNLADLVPILPPNGIFKDAYKHIGEQWSYINQTEEIGSNHSLINNYLPAVEKEVESNQQRNYPCTCI